MAKLYCCIVDVSMYDGIEYWLEHIYNSLYTESNNASYRNTCNEYITHKWYKFRQNTR